MSATGTPLRPIEVCPPAPVSGVGIVADVENDGDRGRAWGAWKAPPRRCGLVRNEARIGATKTKVHVEIATDAAGKPVLLRVEVHKEGSVFRGMLDALSALASQALQHGASVHEVAARLRGVRFEPDGAVVGHETITECTSVVDLVGRMIEAEFPVEGAPCRCVACR